ILLTVDDRDRAAPVALARDQPVAQAVVDLACADAALLQQPRDLVLGRLDAEAVEEFRIEYRTVAVVGLGADGERLGVCPGRPYLRAKSRSRWSWAGQPKMAPVP